MVYNLEQTTKLMLSFAENTDIYINEYELIEIREILADYMDYELFKKVSQTSSDEMIFIVAGTYHANSFKRNIKNYIRLDL